MNKHFQGYYLRLPSWKFGLFVLKWETAVAGKAVLNPVVQLDLSAGQGFAFVEDLAIAEVRPLLGTMG